MLGRQGLVMGDARPLVRAFAEAGDALTRPVGERILAAADRWAEPLLEHLGAKEVHSVDASGYEDSTFVHDLNEGLPAATRGSYTTVLDGGTLEHVFNFPAALRGALEAVEVGGHYVAITPTNNWLGHGFYQFSPELYFRVLSPENGYNLRCMLIRGYQTGAHWYRIADPAEVGHRVAGLNAWPAELYVFAQRVADRPVLDAWPQQSDYVVAWDADGDRRNSLKARLRSRVGTAEPLWVKSLRVTLTGGMIRRTRGYDRVALSDVPRLAAR
jgi:hypothetical protein